MKEGFIMKCAIYVRVSTHDQNTEQQKEKLKEYASNNYWTIFDYYVDEISGRNFDRPQLNRLKKEANKNNFDIILIYSLDRLGRNLKDLEELVNFFNDLDVGIHTMNNAMNIDLNTATGKLFFQMMGTFAEFERNLLKERQRIGIERAKREGKYIGRKNKNVDMDIVKGLLDQGKSKADIARRLNISEVTLWRRLKKQ